MPATITANIRRFIINAETEQALESLLGYLQDCNDTDRCNEIILLYGDFNDFRKKARKGLGEYNTEKNRINLAILSICRELDELEEDHNGNGPEPEPSDLHKRLDQIEGQMQLLYKMMERLTDDGMERFQHSQIWKYLEQKTRDHILAAVAMERDDYLEDYNVVVLEYCEALENELLEKIFLPYRVAFRKDHPEIQKEVFYRHGVSQVKNQLYRFLTGEEESITLNQMLRILFDHFTSKEESQDTPYLSVLEFIYRKFKIKNLNNFVTILSEMSEVKYDKTAKVFFYNKEESDHVKKNVLNIFSYLQPKRRHTPKD
jgi:hypothetical protein